MPDVSFCREIHPGMTGDDVVAHKIALSRWNPRIYPWSEFTDFAGPYFFTALKEYKHLHGLGAAQVLGKRTHESMERAVCHHAHLGQPAFDKRAIAIAHAFCETYGKTPDELKREAGVAHAFWLYAHRMNIAYSQRRPYSKVEPPLVPWTLDCSGFGTVDYWIAKALDPNNLHFNGEGYTGTMIGHGERVSSVERLRLLDLIFYGSSRGGPGFRPGDPTHVAVYVGVVNHVHSVLSMGHFPMGLYPFNYRTINQMRTYPML